MSEHRKSLLSAISAVLSLAVLTVPAKDTKLKPEELVQRHLESIGNAAAREAVKSRVLSGSTTAIFRLGSQGQLSGSAKVVSEGGRTRLGMAYPRPDYPGEQFAFDGSSVTVGQVRPGQRSPLSSFVYHYDSMMREGLLGGAMSTAWALLDVPSRQPRLESTGLKKIEGRQLHELKYRARKGPGDLVITLYFEPETFRHVLTHYRLTVPPPMAASPTQSPGQRDSLYSLMEHFSDFQQVDGLMLPHSYKLVYTIEGQNSTMLSEWSISAEQIAHNTAIDPKVFVVQ